jgi:hypothetical protein
MKQIIFNSAFVPYLIYAKQLIKMNEERYLCTTADHISLNVITGEYTVSKQSKL